MVLSMDRWVGKVAVVTGASAGIGAAIAEQLVENGLVVAGLARRKEKVEELAKKLSGKKGKLHAVKADISKEEDIINAFKWVRDNLGPIHILINNAGVIEDTNLVEGETEKWKKIFNVNVIGLCIATREAVKDMRANKVDGHIIHINSVLGHIAMAGINVYPASKWAVTALTETLRQELNSIGSKIKISSISPGLVDTDMTNSPTMDTKPKLKAVDLADAVTYVLSTPPHVQVHELMVRPIAEAF